MHVCMFTGRIAKRYSNKRKTSNHQRFYYNYSTIKNQNKFIGFKLKIRICTSKKNKLTSLYIGRLWKNNLKKILNLFQTCIYDLHKVKNHEIVSTYIICTCGIFFNILSRCHYKLSPKWQLWLNLNKYINYIKSGDNTFKIKWQ